MTEKAEREIMTIEEAAEFLGVSVKTFNKVLHSQSIPARKIGREWKFSRAALVAWVGGGKSDQFYRDVVTPQNGKRPAPEPADEGSRRTSGWRLKLD